MKKLILTLALSITTLFAVDVNPDEEAYLSFCKKTISLTKVNYSYCLKEWDYLKTKRPLTKSDRIDAVVNAFRKISHDNEFSLYGYLVYYSPFFKEKHIENTTMLADNFLKIIKTSND